MLCRRKLIALSNPVHGIEQSGDKIRTEVCMGPFTRVEELTIGAGEFESMTPFGDPCMSTLEWCATAF